jgi:hypothetical protein
MGKNRHPIAQSKKGPGLLYHRRYLCRSFPLSRQQREKFSYRLHRHPQLLSILPPSSPTRSTMKFISSPESEALAKAVWKKTGRYNIGKRMSLVNARRLIETYSVESVRNALRRKCYLQARTSFHRSVISKQELRVEFYIEVAYCLYTCSFAL